jgi:hypothetical protein
MTQQDRLALLLRTIEEKGQAATARALGVSLPRFPRSGRGPTARI